MHSLLAPQDVPWSFLHVPMPSHELVPMLVVVALVSSWPVGIFVQTPALPETLQDLHVAVQALSQHFPSAQNVLRHSLPPPQFCPSAFLQAPVPSQTLPPLHVVDAFGSG